MKKEIKMVIPKGRIFPSVENLLLDAGLKIEINNRQYIPRVSNPGIKVKIMKPQNIAQLVELGSHDVGFTGFDWIKESRASVEEIMDLKLDPVRIVAAISYRLKKSDIKKKKIIVASEYENIPGSTLTSSSLNIC